MSLSLRTTILATGCILAIGTSAARAQMPLVSYYYRAGQLRHDAGDGQHPGRRLLLQRAALRRPGSGQSLPRPRGLPIPPSTIPRIRLFNASANRPAQGSTYPPILLLSPRWGFHGGRRRPQRRVC